MAKKGAKDNFWHLFSAGDSVTLTAGHDMTLNAAQIGATHDVTVVAGHDLKVGVATDTYEASQTQTKKKTGLQESGGSVMYGKTKEGRNGVRFTSYFL